MSRCTPEELRQGEKSNLWRDVSEEIDLWISELRENLESEDLPLADVPTMRGAIKSLRNVLLMLPIMAENLESLKEENDNDD